MIQKMKYRYLKWKDWCRYSKNGMLYNILVLLGIKKNRWFNSWKIYDERQKY